MNWICEHDKETLRRNTMSIRFTDQEHQLVCNTAWKNRISASGMIREILLNGLKDRGIVAQHDEAPAVGDGRRQQRAERCHRSVEKKGG